MYSSQGNNSYNEQMFYGLEWQNLLSCVLTFINCQCLVSNIVLYINLAFCMNSKHLIGCVIFQQIEKLMKLFIVLVDNNSKVFNG